MRNIFNVLIWNFNTQTIEEYNVIPYFVREWKEEKDKSKFKSFDDIHEQIMMNLDLVTQVFINTIGWKVE